MEGELVKKDVGTEAARRVRIGGQGRHAGAVGHAHFQGAHRGAVLQVKNILRPLEGRAHGVQMQLDAFLHGLPCLALPARENDPARTAAFHFGGHHVQGYFQCGGEGFADLAAHHADLETGIVFQPAPLVGIENATGWRRGSVVPVGERARLTGIDSRDGHGHQASPR